MSVNHEGEKKVFEIHTFCIIPNDAFDEEYDAEVSLQCRFYVRF